jgi:hypothetical protein
MRGHPEDRLRHTGTASNSTIKAFDRPSNVLGGGTMKKSEVPSWVAHVLTPPEVISAYVERRINDPALLSGESSEPTYADFLRDE